MTPAAASSDGGVVLVLGGLIALALGLHLAYAIPLSTVFGRLGAERTRAWIPVLNEAEILRLGGVSPWTVLLFFVPLVQLYGLSRKAVAVSRLHAHFGRGSGLTALAVLLPPVWATVLARSPAAPRSPLEQRLAPGSPAAPGYAVGVSTPQPPAEPLPSAPGRAAVPPPPPPVLAPSPLPPRAPRPSDDRSDDRASASPPARIVLPPGLAPAPAPSVEPSPRPAAPAPAPSPLWAPLDRPAPAAGPQGPEATVATGDLDRTVVVDRRPVASWSLVVEGGPTFRLSGSPVVLGRRPAGTQAGVEEIAVPDPTRTLSKAHARLELADGTWIVTDLDATNGVIVIGADGAETLLDPGASAPIVERILLGKVELRVVPDDGGQPR
jgi:hypothetical protein